MKVSGRNQIGGRVAKVERDGLMAKVTIDVDRCTMTSVITGDAVDDLNIKEGDQVSALVKSTSVMLMK
ncbi:TOBE domain-containing protein [Candidatus Formimonas warabiya]|uniref:Molybdenum-pterin-binding protein n=1 Tax=Formimonas warabiya TaxID=1761012 RepID=A0A3G1KX75_FORW1|nr:TOBE domain-containing protein [Candidatus Formimonas warabiya]ATW26969.1 molybdenum-pterin-binding protein [Candidatus Formimonas warabiya]